jgi:hypothetical protein
MNVVIERKFSNQSNYTAIKTIIGTAGFSNKAINFTDNFDPLGEGLVSYRIRLDIGNDTSFYLKTINPIPVDEIKINPNPVIGTANVVISSSTNANITIQVMNSNGQRVYENTYKQPIGTVTKLINMQGMAAGVYYIFIYSEGKKIITQQIFKK